MKKYNYEQAMTEDILEYIKDNHIQLDWALSEDELLEQLSDMLWAEDCITGNGADYYDTEQNCEEYIAYNLNLAIEACEEFCVEMETILRVYHVNMLSSFLDCNIRCYLLDKCILKAIKQLKEEDRENFFKEMDE